MFGSKQEKKVDSAYFETTPDKVAVRPGMKAPVGIWVHQIHQVEEPTADGQKTVVRRYGTEMCTSTGRNGAGCRTCTMKDPLWDRLEPTKKTNKRGQRTDFPKKVVHVMIVKNSKTNTWQILKGGNQLYEGMSAWYDAQPSDAMKDLRRCEWVIHSEGVKMRKKYFATRLDATNYDFTPEDNAEIQRLLKKAHDDMAPRSTEDFIALINASAQDEANAFGNPGFNQGAQEYHTAMSSVLPTPQSFTTTDNAVRELATPAFAPTVTTPPAQVEAPKSANSAPLKTLTQWMTQQPEFTGAQLVSVGIPMIREFLNGDMNYHSLPPDQVTDLHMKLIARVELLRKK